MGEDLKNELDSQLSYRKLLSIARRRGFPKKSSSTEDVIEWLIQDGLGWKQYELYYNPYIMLKRRICRFFGIKKGWRVMDIGCGSCGTSVAAASLVGSKGQVLAVDQSDEELRRCNNYVEKVGFGDIIKTRKANVLDLEFENDYFDMILLLYTPQFLGNLVDLKEVLSKIRNWTNRIGITDHIPVPVNNSESIYLLYNWLSNDLARASTGKRTDRLFHPKEIETGLVETGWKTISKRLFKVSRKNSFPEWAMRDNIKRLSKQIEIVENSVNKELFLSRLQSIQDLTDRGLMPKPTSMIAIVAERK